MHSEHNVTRYLTGWLMILLTLFWSIPSASCELVCKVLSVDSTNGTVDLLVSASSGERFQIVGSETAENWFPFGGELVGTDSPFVETVAFQESKGFFMVASLDATNGWFASETGDPEFGLALSSSDGNSIVVATEIDPIGNLTRIHGFVWRNPSGGALYYELNDQGLPSSASAGGDLILVEEISDDFTQIRAAVLNQDGVGQLIETPIEVPANRISMTLGAPLDDPGTLSEAFEIIGFAMSAVGCAASASAAIGTGGLAIPLAVLACSGTVASGISLASGDEVSRSFGLFADILGCIIPDDLGVPFACASAVMTIAALVAEDHEETKDTELNRTRFVRIEENIEPPLGGVICCAYEAYGSWINLGPANNAETLWGADRWTYSIDPDLEYPFDQGWSYDGIVPITGWTNGEFPPPICEIEDLWPGCP